MNYRWSSAILLLWLFLVSYAVFGVRSTMMEDDYSFCYQLEEFPAATILYRNWISTGISRFGSHFFERWLLPQLRDQYWIVHLFDVLMLGLNSVLVYCVLMRWSGLFGLSFATAALFCLWPLKNEAVFWGVQFNLHVGMCLMLCAAWAWLRSEPDRPGWWRRAWPVPFLMFLSGQFSEQAFTAAAALPALTLFRPSTTAWAILRRYVVQSLFVAVPLFVYAGLFLTSIRHENLNPNFAARHSVTSAGDVPEKILWVLHQFSSFFPGSRHDRITLRDGLLQFPEIAGEYPWAWGVPLLTAAMIAYWATRKWPVESESRVPSEVWLGLLLFSVMEWLFGLVPMMASREHWLSFRLGMVPGLGVHLFLITAATWIVFRISDSARAAAPEAGAVEKRKPAAPPIAAPRGRTVELAARFALGAVFAIYAFVNLANGRQYYRQFQADSAQARYLQRVLPPDAADRHWLTVGDVPFYSQPYGARNADQIVNVWTMPWAARAMLHKYFPGTIRYSVHPSAANGDAPVLGEQVFQDRADYFVFLLPPWTADFRPEDSELIPVRSVRFIDLQGRQMTLELPMMKRVIGQSRLPPAEVYEFIVADLDSLPGPSRPASP